AAAADDVVERQVLSRRRRRLRRKHSALARRARPRYAVIGTDTGHVGGGAFGAALDWEGTMSGFVWNEQAVNAAPLSVDEVVLLAGTVLAECDAKDGLKDNLISDRCQFKSEDPAVRRRGRADLPDRGS